MSLKSVASSSCGGFDLLALKWVLASEREEAAGEAGRLGASSRRASPHSGAQNTIRRSIVQVFLNHTPLNSTKFPPSLFLFFFFCASLVLTKGGGY